MKRMGDTLTNIWVIRHGETLWNSQGRFQGREDIELNDLGRLQALDCGTFLKKYSWDCIVSSNLIRAVETAEIIAKELSISKIYKMEEFIERDFGIASGMTYEEKAMRFPDGAIPGKEASLLLKKRVMVGMEKLNKSFQGKSVIVITHGGVINAIIDVITRGQSGTISTKLKNTCINIIENDEGNWSIKTHNRTWDELEYETSNYIS